MKEILKHQFKFIADKRITSFTTLALVLVQGFAWYFDEPVAFMVTTNLIFFYWLSGFVAGYLDYKNRGLYE